MEAQDPDTDRVVEGDAGPATDVAELPEPPELTAALPVTRQDRPTHDSEQYRQMGIAYSVPAALVAPVIVLTLMGVWLDGRWGLGSSGFTIGGAVLGIVVGMINVVRMASRLGK